MSRRSKSRSRSRSRRPIGAGGAGGASKSTSKVERIDQICNNTNLKVILKVIYNPPPMSVSKSTQGTNAIPLAQIGRVFEPTDPEAFCEGWPSIDFNHPCDSMSIDRSLQFMQTMRLDANMPQVSHPPQHCVLLQFHNCLSLKGLLLGVGRITAFSCVCVIATLIQNKK